MVVAIERPLSPRRVCPPSAGGVRAHHVYSPRSGSRPRRLAVARNTERRMTKSEQRCNVISRILFISKYAMFDTRHAARLHGPRIAASAFTPRAMQRSSYRTPPKRSAAYIPETSQTAPTRSKPIPVHAANCASAAWRSTSDLPCQVHARVACRRRASYSVPTCRPSCATHTHHCSAPV